MFTASLRDARSASFVLLNAIDEEPTAVGKSALSFNTFLKKSQGEETLTKSIGEKLNFSATELSVQPKASFGSLFSLNHQSPPPPVSFPGSIKTPEAKPALFSGLFSKTQPSESTEGKNGSKADFSKIAFVSKWTGKLRVENKAQDKLKKKISEKIEFKPPSHEYYDNSPVKPGLLFFQTLSKHCNQTQLRVNIPDMIIIYHVITWLFTDSSRVKARKEFELRDFVNAVGPGTESCSAVMRITNERGYGPRVVCLSWTEFNEKVNKLNFPLFGSFQRFVQTAGGHIVTMRLFYRTRGKASKAYSIKLPEDNSRFSLSTEFGVARLEVTELSSHIVETLSQITQRIIDFLQFHYFIRFDTMVLDFVKDQRGVIWLINCKGFLYDNNVSQARLKRQLSASKLDPTARHLQKDSSEDQLNSMHCKLCLLPYRPRELDKVLPFKMLLEYKHHATLNDRAMMDLSHLRASTIDNLSHTLRVCEICFMLVVSECELLKTESKLAKLLLIPEKEIDLTRDPEISQPNFMPAVMHQWRVLIHLEEMTLSPIVGLDPAWWLQYEYLGTVFSHKIGGKMVAIDGRRFDVRITRLHHFFAVMGAATKDTSQKVEIKVRLTYGEKWSAAVLEGSFSPLGKFAFDFSTSKAFVTTERVLLFSDTYEQGSLTVKVGLVLDKAVQAKKLPISIRRFGLLYIPDEVYITSQPLPDVWMEMFEASEFQRTEILSSRDEVERLYDPELDITEELEELNRIHPPKTTPILQKLRTNRLAQPRTRPPDISISGKVSLPSSMSNCTVHRSESFTVQRQQTRVAPLIRSKTPSPRTEMRPISAIKKKSEKDELEHEDTFNDLRALQCEETTVAESSEEIAAGVARYLLKRGSSVKTMRMLRRAESVGSMGQQVPTQSTLPIEPHPSNLLIAHGNTSIELISRPKPKRLKYKKTISTESDCFLDQSSTESFAKTKVRRAMNMSRVYGGLELM